MSSSRVPGVLGGPNQPPFQSTGVGRPMAVARSAPVLGAGPRSGSTVDRVRCVRQAYEQALLLAPSAIHQETGYQLQALIEGLLPGLLQVLIVLVAGTALGGAGGAALGALAGGVGAVPGALLGAQAGLDLGVALLGWLGLGGLALSIAKGIGPLVLRTSRAVTLAWEAAGTADEWSRVNTAARELAQAVAELLRLVLMGIVAYLSRGAVAGATARSAGSLAELVGALRQSRFGAGFAQWVEANAATLMRDPRLRVEAPKMGGGVASQSSTAAGQQPPIKTPLKGSKPSPEASRTGPLDRTDTASNAAVEGTVPALNSPIKITEKGMTHVVERHTVNDIAKFAEKSKFNEGENLKALIESGTQQQMAKQSNGNFARTWDVGRLIGLDRATGQQTSIMTVITNPNGELVTAFPGRP